MHRKAGSVGTAQNQAKIGDWRSTRLPVDPLQSDIFVDFCLAGAALRGEARGPRRAATDENVDRLEEGDILVDPAGAQMSCSPVRMR
jgi:hypothetical protein